MAGIIEQDVSQIPRVLVNTRWLAFERPVVTWGPDTGTCFEASTAFPFHVVNKCFRADVVADEVFVAAEEEDVDSRLDEVWEEVYGGDGFLCCEGLADHTRAFVPAGFLSWVDVQGFDDVWALEVGLDVCQVRRPVHAT